MRIPWFIYLPLSLLVTFLTLYLCVKDVDVVTPPSPEETTKAINEWRVDNPSIRDTKLSDIPKPNLEPEPGTSPKPIPETKPKPEPEPEPKPEPKPEPLVKIPAISPSLSSMAQLNLRTQQLTIYAEHMLENDEYQLARIAYERVIDSAKDATDNDRKNAALAISSIASKTPLWNPDPSVRKNFTLNISINKKYFAYSETLIPKLEQAIFDASDGMLNPSVKIISTDAALSSLDIGNDSAPVRFSIKNNTVVSLKIHAALYNAIRNKNNQSQALISIPALPKHISPQQAVQSYITRLAWVNAAK